MWHQNSREVKRSSSSASFLPKFSIKIPSVLDHDVLKARFSPVHWPHSTILQNAKLHKSCPLLASSLLLVYEMTSWLQNFCVCRISESRLACVTKSHRTTDHICTECVLVLRMSKTHGFPDHNLPAARRHPSSPYIYLHKLSMLNSFLVTQG